MHTYKPLCVDATITHYTHTRNAHPTATIPHGQRCLPVDNGTNDADRRGQRGRRSPWAQNMGARGYPPQLCYTCALTHPAKQSARHSFSKHYHRHTTHCDRLITGMIGQCIRSRASLCTDTRSTAHQPALLGVRKHVQFHIKLHAFWEGGGGVQREMRT